MTFTRKDLLKWTSEFIKRCDDNKIWYVADQQTLLGTYRHGGFVPWHETSEVMMTPESYRQLQRLFPNNVVDNVMDASYKGLQPAFVENAERWMEEKPFVRIRLIVPTTLAKIKKFRSKGGFVKDSFSGKKDTIKNAVNTLYDRSHEGFYTITSRFSEDILNWIPNMSFNRKKMKFNTIEISTLVDSEKVLEIWYGKDYMKSTVPNVYFDFLGPNKTVKKRL